MKVKIGPYVNYVGPYQIADKVFFWCEKYTSDETLYKRWDYKLKDWFGEFLAHGFHKETPEQKKRLGSGDRPTTWFYKLLTWINSKRKRTIKIKTDRWDHWNAEHTMSLLILPILKDLQKHKHGYGFTDDEDVPEHLRSTAAPAKQHDWDTDDNHCKRYEWILDEIIWAHEQIVDDNDEDQFHTGEIDFVLEPYEDKKGLSQLQHGPKHTYTTDEEGLKKHRDRIANGLRLFGKYYQSFWD